MRDLFNDRFRGLVAIVVYAGYVSQHLRRFAAKVCRNGVWRLTQVADLQDARIVALAHGDQFVNDHILLMNVVHLLILVDAQQRVAGVEMVAVAVETLGQPADQRRTHSRHSNRAATFGHQAAHRGLADGSLLTSRNRPIGGQTFR